MGESMNGIVVREEMEGRPLEWASVPRPEIGPGEVLIRAHATAVNRADLVQRRGMYAPPPGASKLLGLEVELVLERADALGEPVDLGEQ